MGKIKNIREEKMGKELVAYTVECTIII